MNVKSFLFLAALFLLLAAPASAADRQSGPSTHRSPLTVSEIMYHPPAALGDAGEFVELCNTEPLPIDLTDFRLAGDIGYTFPTGAVIPGLGYVVVAANPAALAAAYNITNVAGPYTNLLGNAGGRVQLFNRWGAELLDVSYDDDPPWPVAADGAGHALALTAPDIGEASPDAWSASALPGGSPGTPDPTNRTPQHAVLINEFLAHSDPGVDRVELYNSATQTVDISGCRLCDEPGGDCYTIPPATTLAAGGLIAFDETTLGFRLDSGGDDLFWFAPDGSNVLDAVRFNAQELEVSTGRLPDGAPGYHPLTAQTYGSPNTNTTLRPPPVVINEILYRSIDGDPDDEFIELLNRSTNAVDLTHWQLADGVRFLFPPGTTIAPGSYLVVARNAARLIARNIHLNTANTLGNFDGSFSDNSERVTLAKLLDPSQPQRGLVTVDEVTYADGEDWGLWTDGGGSSLELTDPRADNRQAGNWAGSDETKKALWTTIEYTGPLDNGDGTLEQMDVYLMNGGECLVDNLEFIKQGETNNRVGPSTFETGLDGWTPLGTHLRSSREFTEGETGTNSLHIRASDGGRTTVSTYPLGDFDRIWKPVTPVPAPGEIFTVRLRARWLCGWPYVALSLKGFWIEAAGRMHTPANPGTPGLVNSRHATNAPPAVWDLAHTPILPAAGEPVVVSCRIHDPDGLASVQLLYRLDPTNAYTTVAMTPESPGGTGRWRATIPGQTNGAMVGFYVTATDAATNTAARDFPSAVLKRNALVRFGEPAVTSVFGTYIAWVSAANVDELESRSNQANEPVDATIVYNNHRALYNSLLRYRGNFRRFTNITQAAYALAYPAGPRLLGDRESKLDFPSIQFSNGTRQQERHSYWMAESIGHAASYLRYVRARVNGSDIFRHDLQAPTRDFAESWYGDDDAFIHKEEKPLDPFAVYNTTGGVKKTATYSFVLARNATSKPDYDYSAAFRLADALAQASNAAYIARFAAIANTRGWAAYFTGNRCAGNVDSYGYGAGFLHNMYAYIPARGRSRLHLYDMDSAFTATNTPDLFPDNNYPLMRRLFRTAPFERVYWRTLQDYATVAMDPARSDPRLDGWHQVFTNDGLPFLSADAIDPNTGMSMRQWIAARRTTVLAQLAITNASAAVAITSNGGADFTATNALVTLTATAPVSAEVIRINGLTARCDWLTPILFSVRLGLHAGTNAFLLEALRGDGALLGSDTINVAFAGPAVSPLGRLRISEIMYNPPVPEAEFIELLNTSFTDALELGGCRFEGVDFTFPHGTVVAPRGRIVVAETEPGYAAAYTNSEAVAGAFGGNLANEGERLRLFAPLPGGGEALVDEVAYDDQYPWPAGADGEGNSLQLLDTAQGGSHPGAWSVADPGTNRPWVLVSVTGTTGPSPGATAAAQLRFTLQSTGTLPIDNVSIVAGAVPELGTNRVTNGTFESGALSPWTTIGNHARSSLTNAPVHAGTNSLLINATDRGLAATHNVRQGSLGLAINSTYTLSYRYYPTAGVDGLAAEISSTTIRVTHAVSPAPSPVDLATPGRTNSVAQSLPPLPALWINEIGPTPSAAITDNLGEPEPWLELWNASTARIDLAGVYLGTNAAAPLAWAFPTNASVEAGAHLLLWADAETNESVSAALHTSFRLSELGGLVTLAVATNGQPILLDAVTYPPVASNQSFGSVTDGDTLNRQLLPTPTPGAMNNATSTPIALAINEWMADNTLIPDPADGRNQDWFELFNPNPFAVNLAGYRLSDNPGDPAKSVIPNGIWIAPNGFTLVWADEEPGQTSASGDLHVNFRLSNNGETILLSAPNGSLVDSVTFGEQVENRSEGRWPDGVASTYVMHGSTPRTTNRVLRVASTATASNGTQFVVNWASVPGTVYRLDYTTNLVATNWMSLGPVTATTASTAFQDTGAITQRFYRLRIP